VRVSLQQLASILTLEPEQAHTRTHIHIHTYYIHTEIITHTHTHPISSHAGTTGKYMYLFSHRTGFNLGNKNMFSKPGTESTAMPAYQGAVGEFTLLVVFRTRTQAGHNGDMGIINIVGPTDRNTGDKGLSLFKSVATCNRGIPPCVNGRYTSLNALNLAYGDAPARDINTCAMFCGRTGCSLTDSELINAGRDCSCRIDRPHTACAESWGAPEHWRYYNDPDDGWNLVVLRASESVVRGYINGRHWMARPPIYLENVVPFADVEQFRIGVYDASTTAGADVCMCMCCVFTNLHTCACTWSDSHA
jgi:hypothetical protein